MNSSVMAMALETRIAGPRCCMNMKGIVTGKVDANTRAKTPRPPSQSSLLSRACSGGAGSCLSRWFSASSSAGWMTAATADGSAPAIRRWASAGSVASRTARKVRRPVPFSARLPMRYRIPPMIPQAILQPSAPMSIARTSSRVDSATLSEPVKARTMIRPKRTSETRSIGSRTFLVDLTASADMGVRWVGGEQGAGRSGYARRQQVERHRENGIDREQQHADEPRRPAAVRDEAPGEGGEKDHDHRARPELQVHRRRAEHVAQQHQHRRDKKRNLGRTAHGNAHAQIQAVLARAGKRGGHFRRAADQRHDDEAHERLGHPERFRGFLHGFDEHLADERDQH